MSRSRRSPGEGRDPAGEQLWPESFFFFFVADAEAGFGPERRHPCHEGERSKTDDYDVAFFFFFKLRWINILWIFFSSSFFRGATSDDS